MALDSSKKDGEVIFISEENLKSGETLMVLVHEYGHLNTYDTGEETAQNMEDKVSVNEEKNKDYTEYLEEAKKEYSNLPSTEDSKLLSELIPEEDKEKFYDKKTHDELKTENPDPEKVSEYANKFNVSEEEVKEDYTKFAYFNALETKNKKYSSKSEFEKQQKELQRQVEAETDSERRAELENGLYKKQPDKYALYHNVKIDKNGNPYIDTAYPNEKWVNLNGQEAVFNKATGEWVSDGINDATYNIALWEHTILPKDLRDLNIHLKNNKGDVKLWKEYGVGSNDKLTKEQREQILIEGGKVYNKITGSGSDQGVSYLD